MKKNAKQIIAVISLIVIAVLFILFVISAFLAKPGDNSFFALFFAIIAVPILAWLFLLCYGRMKGKHTMAEFFPKDYNHLTGTSIPQNPDHQEFTEEEITQAMENSQK